MPNLYASLSELRSRLPGLSSTTDDDRLLDALEDASRALDAATHRHFYPKIATYYFDFRDANYLKLNRDLLSITTFTTSNGADPVTASEYFLKCGDDYNQTPYNYIEIDQSVGGILGYSGTIQRSQAITGVWGYHNDYSNAYLSSGATVGETFSDSDTTLTVSNGGAFERGQIIKIESEWLYVTAIGSNDLTLSRAQNGSTAASHANGTAITIYKPMRDVERVMLRYAAWLYKQYESPFTFELQTDAQGTVIIPPNAPPEVHQFIKRYMARL